MRNGPKSLHRLCLEASRHRGEGSNGGKEALSLLEAVVVGLSNHTGGEGVAWERMNLTIDLTPFYVMWLGSRHDMGTDNCLAKINWW